jgi:hypothetical protein
MRLPIEFAVPQELKYPLFLHLPSIIALPYEIKYPLFSLQEAPGILRRKFTNTQVQDSKL